jgi:hypothetical protein
MEDGYLVLAEVDHRRSEGLAECLVSMREHIVDQNQGNRLDINTSWLGTNEAALLRRLICHLEYLCPGTPSSPEVGSAFDFP